MSPKRQRGIDCAWHTLRHLQEVSPSFLQSQFRFLQPLLPRCVPTPSPAPFIPWHPDGDTQHWDFASPGPGKLLWAKNKVPLPVKGRAAFREVREPG